MFRKDSYGEFFPSPSYPRRFRGSNTPETPTLEVTPPQFYLSMSHFGRNLVVSHVGVVGKVNFRFMRFSIVFAETFS